MVSSIFNQENLVMKKMYHGSYVKHW